MSSKVKKSTALIIFFKNPVLGKVKTRIGIEVGDHEALNIYRQMYSTVKEKVLSFDADKFLYYSDEIESDDEWENHLFIKKVQQGRDLGERMANAFREALEFYEKVLIIGTDFPGINEAILTDAVAALERKYCVVGPCRDGGYFLLGLKDFDRDLFENIEWSTSKVLEQTIQKLEQKDKAYCLLSVQNDIDHHKDWLEYLQHEVNEYSGRTF